MGVSSRKSRTHHLALTRTPSAEVWLPTPALLWSWELLVPHTTVDSKPCHHKWRPSSSGASAESGSTRESRLRTSPSRGRAVWPSALSFTTFSLSHSTSQKSTQRTGDRTTIAFKTGERYAGIPDFLTAEDMDAMVRD